MSYPTWDEVVKSHEVHEETLSLTRTLAANGVKMYHQTPLEDVRPQFDEFYLQSGLSAVDETMVTRDITIPSNENSRPGPLTVYTPQNLKGEAPKIIVYIHGGGLIFGSARGYSHVMEKLATTTGSIVVGVEYRLLPDAGERYAPVSDCVHAVKWIQANKETLGGKPNSKVGVAGDSSGGQLSLLVALDTPGIGFAVIVYPATDLSTTTASAREFMEVPIFNGKDLDWVNYYWKQMDISQDDPRVVPAARKDLPNLPPTLMIVAALDPLKDSNLAFAKRLKDSGVKTQLSVYSGVPHGFIGPFDCFPTTAGRAYDEMATFVASQ